MRYIIMIRTDSVVHFIVGSCHDITPPLLLVAPPRSLLIRHLVCKHGHGDPDVLVERDAEKVRVLCG
eukprot:COSAG01_NODE_494_length_16322_cov_35.380879_6_plen_67_part_00